MMKIDYVDSLYFIKDEEWLINQRFAGKVLSEAIQECAKHVIPGKTTEEINKVCEEYILSYSGCQPAFKGYMGFPAGLCISINEEIVHGIPGSKIIQDGDIVKIDSGVNYKGSIADMARTVIAGECKNIKHKILIEYVEKSLQAAINSFKFEKGYYNRVGNIGYAIYKEAKKINANVVTDLGGHGLEKNQLHGSPFISNVGEKDKGAIIYPGTTIAIEPILTSGKPDVKILDDRWTVSLKDVGVHWEDTLFIHEDRVEKIT